MQTTALERRLTIPLQDVVHVYGVRDRVMDFARSAHTLRASTGSGLPVDADVRAQIL